MSRNAGEYSHVKDTAKLDFLKSYVRKARKQYLEITHAFVLVQLEMGTSEIIQWVIYQLCILLLLPT